jgi:tetratricopeptide (TPR) repeat protein
MRLACFGVALVRTILCILAVLYTVTCTPAIAQGMTRGQAAQAFSRADAPGRRDAVTRLGAIGTMADLALLARALRDVDPPTRALAEAAMWKIWARSGDAQIDKIYQQGIEEMEAGNLAQSIATFTRIIELRPEFAESWNKRATLYFLVGELHKSLADCHQVVKRNPYHFGVLSGYAEIYIRLKDYRRALEYSRRALAVNPNLEGVRVNIGLLERILEQHREQMI